MNIHKSILALALLLVGLLVDPSAGGAQALTTARAPNEVQRKTAERTNLTPRLEQLESTRRELQSALDRAVQERAPKATLDTLRQHLARVDQTIARVRQRLQQS